MQDLVHRAIIVESVESADWLQIAAVDASIVATAERLGIRTIATFDRRHFTVVRPAHCEAFDLVP